MNTFMPRMLFLSCITMSLILSGCGPKEVEPYQGVTEAMEAREATGATGTPGMSLAKTYPLSSYSTLEEEQDQQGQQGSIAEEDLESGEIASLASALPLPDAADSNTTIIETLDTGSGAGEQRLGFGDLGDQESKSVAYRKEHGRSSIQLRPVYFDFDSAGIRKDQIASIEHNAEYLKSNVASKVLVEGNCDELGTNEYNLALGERRAMNARNYLIKLGVSPSRIRTVSYGEERPLFTGSEESDYTYNRRDDFVLE